MKYSFLVLVQQHNSTIVEACLILCHKEGFKRDITVSPTDGPKDVLLSVSPPGDVVQGSSVTFTCSSSGSNPPIQSYIIFKDNTLVSQKEMFTISNIQPSDSGTYSCQAENNIATVTSPGLTVDVCEY